jgi:hypothetical protein
MKRMLILLGEKRKLFFQNRLKRGRSFLGGRSFARTPGTIISGAYVIKLLPLPG